MAKEMMIVFVYDTARCCKEEDDPADAVMYFHPAWVSATQRLALAGQLMGVNQFLTTCFSPPTMISLQGGKFVLKKFERFMLAVGTDRNIQDWILERRANILESLLRFFHCDFDTISTALNNDRVKFTEKLYQMFETYLPILQYNASLFSNIPTLKLPRGASNVFLEAIQVLQFCQETSGIIGGALFYNNKVVASQLNAEITKLLIITDPYRIKAQADKISTSFHLPVGVQLMRIYIEQSQFSKIVQDVNSERSFTSCMDSVTKKSIHKKNLSKTGMKDQTISLLKRDTSRIFTVPEEGEVDLSQYSSTIQNTTPYQSTYSSPAKRKNEDKVDKPKHQHPLTPSVCSTPLSNVNRVLHGTAVSICCATDEVDSKFNTESNTESTTVEQNINLDDIPDVVKEALRCKRLNKFKNATHKETVVITCKDPKKKSLSINDLEEVSDRTKFDAYNLGVPKLTQGSCTSSDAESPVIRKRKKRIFKTIADPSHPLFRNDGLPISKSLYDQFISSYYQELNRTTKMLNYTSDVSNIHSSVKTKSSSAKCSFETVSEDSNDKQKTKPMLNLPLDNKVKQETYRRSMSLPLKPLNVMDTEDRRKSTSECSGVFDMPQRRKLDGLQLTPLMSKLSLLADERTSGFCSRETTPSEFRDFSSYSMTTSQLIKSKLEAANKESGSDGDDEIDEDWSMATKDSGCYEKCELFLCGHQNMVLVLLMEDGTANDPDLIHTLWETCVSTLGNLETRLQQCLEPLPSNESKELYSVLCVDREWDTIHRSGLWGVTELDIVASIHDRFSQSNNLTDIIARTEDTVVYGNQCGKVEVFYQQAIAPNASGGLPTPADLMGTVPLKAKQRLERDHGIILL